MVFLKGQGNQSGNVPNVWTVDSEYGWDGTPSDAHWNGSSAGRLLTGTTDTEGRTVTYAYDNRDRITKTAETVTDGNGGSHEASITYQYEGNRLSAIGHNGFFYTFTYDAYGKRPGQRPAGTRSLRKRTSRRTGLLQARHMQTGIRSCMRTMPVRSWKAFPITGQRPLRISMTVPGMRSSMKTSWTRPGISLTTIPWGGSCGWRPAAGSPWS